MPINVRKCQLVLPKRRDLSSTTVRSEEIFSSSLALKFSQPIVEVKVFSLQKNHLKPLLSKNRIRNSDQKDQARHC